MSYYRDVYLKSDEWKTLRVEKLVERKSRCTLCRVQSDSNDVHHLKYHHLWDVKLHDLMVLCRPCHDWVHSVLKKYPKMKKLNSGRIYRAILQQYDKKLRDEKLARRVTRADERKTKLKLKRQLKLKPSPYDPFVPLPPVRMISKGAPIDKYRARFFEMKRLLEKNGFLVPRSLRWFDGLDSRISDRLFDTPLKYIYEYVYITGIDPRATMLISPILQR